MAVWWCISLTNESAIQFGKAVACIYRKNKKLDRVLTAVLTSVIRGETKVWADCANKLSFSSWPKLGYPSYRIFETLGWMDKADETEEKDTLHKAIWISDTKQKL